MSVLPNKIQCYLGRPDGPGSPWEGWGADGLQLDPGFGRRTWGGGIQDNGAEPAPPLPASFEDLRGPPLVWLLCGQVLMFPMAPVYHPSLLPDLQSAPDPSTSRAEKYEPDLGHIKRFARFVASVTPSQVTREAGGHACGSHASEARAAYRSDCFEVCAVTRDSEFHGLDSEAGGRSLSSRVVDRNLTPTGTGRLRLRLEGPTMQGREEEVTALPTGVPRRP